MITKNRHFDAPDKIYVTLLVFFAVGLILPFQIYRSAIMDDRLFCAVSCIFIFCASLCSVSAPAAVFQPLLCLVFAMMIGKNLCASTGRFIFCCISFPLFFYISANGIYSASHRQSSAHGFTFVVGIVSLAAAMFLLCMK